MACYCELHFPYVWWREELYVFNSQTWRRQIPAVQKVTTSLRVAMITCVQLVWFEMCCQCELAPWKNKMQSSIEVVPWSCVENDVFNMLDQVKCIKINFIFMLKMWLLEDLWHFVLSHDQVGFLRQFGEPIKKSTVGQREMAQLLCTLAALAEALSWVPMPRMGGCPLSF